MSDIQFNLVCCTQTILHEIANKATQKYVAVTYAIALKSEAQGADKPDWPKINRAILDRWSMSGLERIKKWAWDLVLKGKEP